jgi:hypothetical protein
MIKTVVTDDKLSLPVCYIGQVRCFLVMAITWGYKLDIICEIIWNWSESRQAAQMGCKANKVATINTFIGQP